MQTRMVLVALSLAIVINLSGAQQYQRDETAVKKVPAFVQSLEKLYQGPPIPPTKSRAVIKEEWIEQKLDHFDESETRTWRMRYMVNDEHFKAGGPIFIVVGGEWEISPGMINGGHFYDMAEEHNGMLYYTEHRYYGNSRPTSDITVDNLKYLHVKQALADLAHFIRYQHENVPELANAKVILSGGSYAATMVVWFKRLYPELATGGWASSAPILAKVDFREYKEVVGQAMLELGSRQCYNRIQNGIADLEAMFAQQRGAEVKAMMKICNNFNENNDLDLWSLFGTISNLFASIAQYQDDGDIPFVCDYLMQFEDDATAIAGFLLAFVGGGCVDLSYKSTLAYYMDSTYEQGASRPWYYQTCNEYGWYQSSGSSNQPFGTKFPVTLYTTMCADIFGDYYTNERINLQATQTNADFGGMNPAVDHVFMTHGGLDPWSPMGHNETQGAVIITNHSHCKDFGSLDETDSKELQAAKEGIAKAVREWLAE